MNLTQDVAEQKKTKSNFRTVSQHVVEIVSDSGEGAQKAGQSFGSISAKMGNGVWTVEIIPAEIQPPARSRAGASGIRIRVGSEKVTNMGDHANLVVALNEQVLYGRIAQVPIPREQLFYWKINGQAAILSPYERNTLRL